MVKRVSEFVILTPEVAFNALVYSRERLRTYLETMFPQYSFSLARMEGDEADNAFVVVPVVGTVGDEERPGEMKAVSDGALVEIRQALEAFRLHSALLH